MSGMRIDTRVSCVVSRRYFDCSRLQRVDTFICPGFGVLIYLDADGCGARTWISKAGVFAERIVGVFCAVNGFWRGEKSAVLPVLDSLSIRKLAAKRRKSHKKWKKNVLGLLSDNFG